MTNLQDQLNAAITVIKTGDPTAKCAAARDAHLGQFACHQARSALPERPARPTKPELVSPDLVPRRKIGSPVGRFALLHAVAHIEFNAINLAFDMAARFAGEIDDMGLDQHSFVDDWFSVGDDEARHFSMISNRLVSLGGTYGDLPAHDGLWDVARNTQNSVLARLVVAPMVLEARGLDVTPSMIEKLISVGDHTSADILSTIYEEEIGHVKIGAKWFHRVCTHLGKQPEETFKVMVKQYFRGELKPPFNIEARTMANLPEAFYH